VETVAEWCADPRASALARRRLDFAWSPPALVPVGAILILVAVHAWVAMSATHPVLALDEVVMLGNSRVLVGAAPTWQLAGAGFMPGLAILIAPLWWFLDDPSVVYRIGIVVAVLLNLAAVWPLSLILRRCGASATASVTVAAVVMVAPARSLISNYLVSESLFLLATCVLVLVAMRMAEEPNVRLALACGLAAGAVVLAHGRGVALAAALGIWLLTYIRSHRVAAVVGAVSVAVGVAAAYMLYRAITATLVVHDLRMDETLGGLAHFDSGAFLATVIGQAWYASLAWPAIAYLGLGLIAFRARRPGVARFILIAVAVSIAFAAITLNTGVVGVRQDAWYYGRYMDHLWTVLAAMGLVVAVRVRWWAASVAVAGATAAVAVLMLLVTVPRIDFTTLWVDMHVLGISPWLSINAFVNGEPQPWLMLCALSLVLTCVVLVLAWFRSASVVVLAVGWAALSVAHDSVIDLRDGGRAADSNVGAIRDLPASAEVAIDRDLGYIVNMFVFDGRTREVALIDVADRSGTLDVLYARPDDRRPRDDGALVFIPSLRTDAVAWVYPGPVFDELESAGQLVSLDDLPRT